jgi:hypothetical protein
MVEGVNSSMIYCKNFCKCHNVTPPNTTIKNKQNPNILPLWEKLTCRGKGPPSEFPLGYQHRKL